VSEVREYMQSRDNEFSHTLDPELEISNQGLSGRCWMFAVLNVMRHELIRKFNLTHEFELSESYLCFYEKLEKCNYFLSEFMDADGLDVSNERVRNLLLGGCDDGGLWVTCANLIKKYGIVPKSSYRESINSFSTETMNSTINHKLREFSLKLTSEKDKNKRVVMKSKMMEEIYNMLCKMLGTPPNPNEKFKWSFILYLDLTKQLEREKKRRKTGHKYENLQIKNTFEITPVEFYEQFIVNSLDDYVKLGNDPRNEYGKYYQSHDRDVVVEGTRNGFYNVPMEVLRDACLKSIVDNTPVQFDCDVGKYLNPDEELLDDKCYDYNLVFGSNFDNMSKEQMMRCFESYPNHAMVLVGVDMDQEENVSKWKIENSWGRNDETTGYWTMSHEWFNKYVFNVVVNKKYIPEELLEKYETEAKQPITFPEFDLMG
jgi:bleomycin hydrolase